MNTQTTKRSVDILLISAAFACFAWAFWSGTGSAGALGLVPTIALAAASASPSFHFGARLTALTAASACMLTAANVPPIWPLVQLVLGLPALALATAKARPQLREWLQRGRVDMLPVLVLGGAAALALPAWVALAKPDLSAATSMLPRWPWAVMAAAALAFAVVNALLEEVLFRGLLQGALASLWGSRSFVPVLLQGAAFGVMHWHGFPSGVAGIVLAGGWGALLGWARQRSGGLATPIIAHVVADAVIFIILFGHLAPPAE